MGESMNRIMVKTIVKKAIRPTVSTQGSDKPWLVRRRRVAAASSGLVGPSRERHKQLHIVLLLKLQRARR